jgi:hypothetical protein
MRSMVTTAAAAALLAVAVTPFAASAKPVSPGQCTLRFRQVTSEPLPGGLGQPYFDCTY